nr:SocA family protein [Nitrospira sp.]
LMKLVYLADRASFIERGVPITGDSQYAMKLGPVPSNTLNLIDGELHPFYDKVYQFIQLNNVSVSLANDPGDRLLSADEKAALEGVWRQHGHKLTIPLCYETHRLPEYMETFVVGTSTLIPYETIAKHSGNPARFRLGRPVISPEMAVHIAPPFPAENNL